ncbi:class I SAM-dependent methyltransferase [Winogradskyella sp. KYW1333]|uniref:class I SAM-dependent methyltransferase n=1 Tax=Winogradskyella sp. KYW1333 TaxID=2282123 RepID=UPI000DF13195|nr:class I SAM-dependent methyltransferase [Winogradskyella sp. KYW1333]RCT55353.1 class I SAM-dependent methyltransferase [Winogradskyella sp. KYW1333]
MLAIRHRNGKYYYSIFHNPISRVLKAKLFIKYFDFVDKRDTVLDYGSGDAPYKKMLIEYFDNYVSADYEVTNMKHNRRPEIGIDDDQKVDVGDNTFSCVVLSEVLEHIYKPHEALQEIRRIVVPEGYVIGTVPFFMWEHEKPYDFHRYTYFCLKHMFEENGFEIVKLDYVGDNLGVLTYIHSKFFGVFIKPLRTIKPLHFILKTLINLPGFIYYLLIKIKFVERLLKKYFGEYPFGFAFLIKKSKDQ